MTSQPIQQPSVPAGAGKTDRTAGIRFLIVGIVLLAVTITNLVVVVEDWSTATSSGFITDHILQLIGAVIGLALVITGIVKYFRR